MRKFIAGIEIFNAILVLCLSLIGLGMRIGLESTPFGSKQIMPWSLDLVLLILFPIGFMLINFIAGAALWKNKKLGYVLSIITQFIQLFSIQTSNFYFYCYSLVGAIFAFSKTGLTKLFGLGFEWRISFDPQPVTTIYIGINIVALILISIIFVLYRKKIKSS